MRLILNIAIISSLLLVSGCDKETKPKNDAPSIEKVIVKNRTKKPEFIDYEYTLTDAQNNSLHLLSTPDTFEIAGAQPPLLLINIFKTNSSPSKGMIPYLNDLQKKYEKDIFVLGLPLDYTITDSDIIEFMKKHDARYFISTSAENRNIAQNLMQYIGFKKTYKIPATILFKNGKYITHYIGATPIEMIEGDVKQMIEKEH